MNKRMNLTGHFGREHRAGLGVPLQPRALWQFISLWYRTTLRQVYNQFLQYADR